MPNASNTKAIKKLFDLCQVNNFRHAIADMPLRNGRRESQF